MKWMEGRKVSKDLTVYYKMTKELKSSFQRMADYLKRREDQKLDDMVSPDKEAIMVSK